MTASVATQTMWQLPTNRSFSFYPTPGYDKSSYREADLCASLYNWSDNKQDLIYPHQQVLLAAAKAESIDSIQRAFSKSLEDEVDGLEDLIHASNLSKSLTDCQLALERSKVVDQMVTSSQDELISEVYELNIRTNSAIPGEVTGNVCSSEFAIPDSSLYSSASQAPVMQSSNIIQHPVHDQQVMPTCQPQILSSTEKSPQSQSKYQEPKHLTNVEEMEGITSGAADSSSTIGQVKEEKHELQGEKQSCQVCLDNASGYFYDAFICEACKKFFNRALKQNSRPSCVKGNTTDACVINKQTRSSCPACRFKKCLDIGMKPPGESLLDRQPEKTQNLRCKICNNQASGFHFGVLSCEGCKGFFRRSVKDQEIMNSIKCQRMSNCVVDYTSKPLCRPCRYQKCLREGMSVDRVKQGRCSNMTKYARLMEAKEGDLDENKMADGTGLMDTSMELTEEDQLDSSPLPDNSPPLTAAYQTPASSAPLSNHQPPPPQYCHPEPAAQYNAPPAHPPVTFNLSCTPIPIPVTPNSILERTEFAAELLTLREMFEAYRISFYKVYEGDRPIDYHSHMSDVQFISLIFSQFLSMVAGLVGFLKKSSGFRMIDQDDQMTLTKASMFRCSLFATAQDYDTVNGTFHYIVFKSNDPAVHRLFSICPEYQDVYNMCGEKGRIIKDTNCSMDECVLLLLLNALNIDHEATPGLKVPQIIRREFQRYREILWTYVRAHSPNPMARMNKMDELLEICRQAGILHTTQASLAWENHHELFVATEQPQMKDQTKIYRSFYKKNH